MTHILIPREPSTALLRPFIGCNTQELHEAWAAMVRIAEVQHARSGSQCLAQIEEPAAPAAAADTVRVADLIWAGDRFYGGGQWYSEEGVQQLIDAARKHAAAAPALEAPSGVAGRTTPRNDDERAAAQFFADNPGAALLAWPLYLARDKSPALEAPAAPDGDLALIIAALEHGQPQMAHYAEPRERHAKALAAARRLAAAPQAPAAPVADAGAYAALPAAVAHSLGLAKYAHSSNIIAAHEFTPDAEHADEWESLVTLDQARAFADATHALRIAVAAPAAPAVDAASDTALLDAMQRHRIALVPEFEGPWDAEIFNDEAEAHPIASGNTPREALRAALAAQAKEGGEA